MTRLLKKAFEEASKLDGPEQDSVARWLLEELAADRQWDDAFRASTDQLGKLADEALAEHRGGKTELLDPDSL